MPERIQRKRAKGWRMPPNTRYVGRGSIYGNPFRVEVFGRALAVELYRRSIQGHWMSKGIPDHLVDTAYQGFQEILLRHRKLNTTLADWARTDLKGVNLCDWCALDEECHADVLLALVSEAAHA